MKNYSYDGRTINISTDGSTSYSAGEVIQVATGWYAVAVTDIPVNGYGTALQCGVFNFQLASGTLTLGADFKMIIATQVYNAGTGVTIGKVMGQEGTTVQVLLNSLPGGVG